MQKLPDPSLINGAGQVLGALFDKVNQLVDAVNSLRPTGPTSTQFRLEALEQVVRTLTVRLEGLERQVRLHRSQHGREN